jgi:hypothetical protein
MMRIRYRNSIFCLLFMCGCITWHWSLEDNLYG